jgi:integrase
MLGKYLDNESNERTKSGKKSLLSDYFFIYIYKEPKTLDMTKCDELAERYLNEIKEGRNYFQDLLGYIADLSKRVSSSSVGQYVSAVKGFLAFYDYDFKPSQLMALRKKTPSHNAVGREDGLKVEDISRILQHSDLKMRALILVLASSGMRIGEALSITLKDVDLDHDPPVIHISGKKTKTKTRRTTFLSQEARGVLVEWLKVREKYIKQAMSKNQYLMAANYSGIKDKDDDCVFPFSITVAHAAWDTLLEKTGLMKRDEDTNWTTRRLHTLRKFFRTRMALGVNVDLVESLMGHGDTLTNTYRKYEDDPDTYEKEYKKGEPYVTIQQTNIMDIEEVKKETKNEIDELKAQLAELANIVNELRHHYGADERLGYKESYRELVGKTE